MPYRCAKFERNQSTGRVFFGWLKVTFVKRYEEEEEEEDDEEDEEEEDEEEEDEEEEEEEKGEENSSGTHISRTTWPISFKFGM